MDAGSVLGRVCSDSTIDDAQSANAVRVEGFAAAVEEGLVGVCIRICALCRGVGNRAVVVVAAGVAVAVRVRHARGQGSRSLAIGARGRIAPASVAAIVFGHGEPADSGERGVVIGVEAVFLDFLSALVLGRLALLALAPEEEASESKEGDDDNGDDDSDGRPAAGAQAARAPPLGILQLCRVGARRASGARERAAGGSVCRAIRGLDG